MPWMDFFDITNVFEVSGGVDAHHFRFLKFSKWLPGGHFLYLETMFCALT
jgi:hypothetical protein